MTVHLVYPHENLPSAPDVIGHTLGRLLSDRHEVVHHDWDDLARISPQRGDVLLGHPHPLPGTVFRRSMRDSRWGRRLVMSPFNGDAGQVAFLDPMVRRSDAYLAITGRYWAQQLSSTPMRHWSSKFVHLDLAVDRLAFPRIKEEFAGPGDRSFLFVGHSGWQKNPQYLANIAAARPQWRFGWMGGGEAIAGVVAFGRRDMDDISTRRIAAGFDFSLTVGRADANPTTVLEAMAWGLVPVCTPTSGYVEEPGVVNVPLGDLPGALAVLDDLQAAPPGRLEALRQANDERLAAHYTWDRFAAQVMDAIEAPPGVVQQPARADAAALLRARAASPYAPWGVSGRRLVRTALTRRVRDDEHLARARNLVRSDRG